MTLITGWGEYADINPSQGPPGKTTQAACELMRITAMRASDPGEVDEIVRVGLDTAFRWRAGRRVVAELDQP